MTSQSKLYISDDFRPERTKNFILLLQIRERDFSFAVVYQKELQVYGKNYPLNELLAPQELSDYLSQEYNKVIIGIEPQVFTILPKSLHKDELDVQVSRFLDVNEHEKVYRQSLNDDNFIFFKDGNQMVPQITARYKYYHICFFYKGWIKAISETEANWQNFYIDVQPDAVHLLYFKNNKLRFYNRLSYENTHELVYFVALTLSELQINPVNIKLMLSGEVSLNDETIRALSEYFPKIEINALSLLSRLPQQLTIQEALSLSALNLCA
ncbi:DUF3822 family protein [Mucilaginibacter sp. KACC 22063]|uniref:DUF3822 family protein n=1 Tax=Mucilaginibacter sp. KACC 22063 TaxID=3025666 RepID=UPI0023659A3C|nr:DUF3822 family protein [Mucilaginibacter sp. KACC 22063]WDF53866.1 DUF3822 family protein [Mucilaginibacter sp. KACC 22063]